MRSTNPLLSEKAFENRGYSSYSRDLMTIDGTVNKVGMLLLLTAGMALFSWMMFGGTGLVQLWMIVGAIGGFITAMVTVFQKHLSGITAPIYALFEGVFLGCFSGYMETIYPGIAFQAVCLTFFVLFSLLLVYKARIINVTQNFRLGVFAATAAIGLYYLFSFTVSFFGVTVPFIHDSGLMGIGFSVVVVVVASLNLVLDFDFIEKGSQSNLPKYMEWYGAFGLMVTLIWLYVELIRLLAKLRSNK
ncbi:MAG: hypothetical protein A2Y25_04950 [Candidatus Melainabacteria bacterium GWF2_37_15]|nr:MAG: hypothetical protein A2Y25_04950 [Candidatus Melainabacteria bacterium GWF2_37_15]